MADSDKLIGIFPETGISDSLPRIEFTGKDNKKVSLRTEDNNDLHFVNASGNSLLRIATTGLISVSGGDSGKWNEAYSWGDHSASGYALDSTVVKTTGDQNISGAKTFQSNMLLNANVGIGTSAPSSKLDVNGNVSISSTGLNGESLFSIEGTNGNLFSVVDSVSGSLLSVNDITGLPAFEVFSDHSVVAGRFNQNDFVVSSGGNVGIGTSAPSGKLDVNGTVYLGTSGTINNVYVRGVGVPEDRLKIRTDNFGSLYLDAGAAYVKAGGSDARVELVAGNSYINIGNSAAGTPAHQYVAFRPANSEAMRIDAAGRVGIGGFGAGQTSYAYKLEVKNAAPFFYPNETGEDAAALHLGRYSNGYGTFFSIRTHDESTYRTNFVINRFIGRYRFSIADGTLGLEHQAEICGNTGGNVLDLYNFNNEVKTKISAGTADSYFNGGGKVGIGTSSPSSMLDIRTSGNPVLIARTSNGQNIFQYLKFDDTNLLRASFDGSNFHHYLGAQVYYNIGTHGVTFDGGGGTNQSPVSITNRAYIALSSNTTSAPGNANIYAGPGAYATVDNQLTNISPIAIKTWAWNGSDGFTLGAVGYIKQTQNSATNGDARLSIVEGATNSEILVVDYAKKNVGIGTTTPGSKLEVNGEIAAGGTSAFTFAGNYWGYDKIIFRKDVNNKITSDASGNYNWLVAGKNWTLSDVGNVGIGTTVLSYKLNVNPASDSNNGIQILNNSAGTSARSLLSLHNGNYGAEISLGCTGFTNNGFYRQNKLLISGPFITDYVTGQHHFHIGGGGTLQDVAGSTQVGFWDINALTVQNELRPTGGIAGGTLVGSSLTLKSTTAVGTTDYISLAVGNNGATEAIRIINSGYVGINTSTPTYNLQVNGSFAASTKSFRIDHPSQPNYTLEYGSLESPYHGVRLTGRGRVVKGVGVVDLPPYLKDLIHDDENINIQLTNLKHGKTLYVSNIDLNNSQFTVRADRAKTLPNLEFFWTFSGVRKDVDHLVVEKPKEV